VEWGKSREYAQAVANKIKTTLAAPYVLQIQDAGVDATQIEHRCSASIGVVVFSSENAHPDELTKWADAAMYQAKKNGRDQIYVASETS
jgi:diguanylate cyclase (GGDEF)-like protein